MDVDFSTLELEPLLIQPLHGVTLRCRGNTKYTGVVFSILEKKYGNFINFFRKVFRLPTQYELVIHKDDSNILNTEESLDIFYKIIFQKIVQTVEG